MIAFWGGWVIGVGFGFSLAMWWLNKQRKRCPELRGFTLSTRYGNIQRTLRCEELDEPDGKPHDGPCCAREGLSNPVYWEPGEPQR